MSAADFGQLMQAIEQARNVAFSVRGAVLQKGCPLFSSRAECDGMRWTADQNLRNIEMLPEVLEGALRDRPEEREASLAQAMLIVEDTEKQTQRLAGWAERNDLGELARAIWAEIRRLFGLFAGATAGIGLLLLGLVAVYLVVGR